MKSKGFTLVELLIVMAIIGVLIAIAIVGLGAAQADARNSARETAVKGIAGLLETYYGANGQTYPSGAQMNSAGNVEFYDWASPNPYWATQSSLCKPTIVASPNQYSNGGCGQYSDFCNPTGYSTGPCNYPTTSTNTQYIYVPYTNGSPTNSNVTVTGYLIGACLENNTLFVYTANGSNAPYTKTGPDSVKIGNTTFTCAQ